MFPRKASKMFSLNASAWNCAKPLPLKPLNFSLRRLIVTACSCTKTIPAGNPDFSDSREQLSNRLSGYSGTRIEETVNLDSGKLRLDSWIASQINGISRARVQSSIRSGLVSVNGHVVSKVIFSSFFFGSTYFLVVSCESLRFFSVLNERTARVVLLVCNGKFLL